MATVLPGYAWQSALLATGVALGVMVLVVAAAGVWCLLRARAGLRVPGGGPFALTLGELDRDLDGLEPSPGTARTPAPPPP